MKFILLIFFSFSLTAQKPTDFEKWVTKNNDQVHLWACTLVDATAYHIQSYACPNWKPAKKLLVANLITFLVANGKEIFDKYKPNATGFNKWEAFFLAGWSIAVYDLFNIAKRDFLDRDVADAYVKRYHILDSLEPGQNKFKLSRKAFLN